MNNEPKYVKVKHSILRKIQNRDLLPNDKLASEEEYAKHYGVSTITVKKALSELASEGYIRRTKGQGSFVESSQKPVGTSHLVALVLSSEYQQDSSVIQIIIGAQQMLSNFGYALIVEWNEGGLEEEKGIIQKMLAQGVEGFLIYPFDPVPSTANYSLIEHQGFPYVLIDRYNPEHKSFFAGCDNYNGAITATRKLLRLKHTKIKFASYHFFLSSEQERFDGYCHAMRQAGLEITKENLLTDINYDMLANDILAHNTTAIFCCNDRLALKMIENLIKRGIRIPQDVSIFGFDDWSGSQQSAVSISTLKQDFEEEGGNAAILLINAMKGHFKSNDTRLLSGAQLILRESVCKNPYANPCDREKETQKNEKSTLDSGRQCL